LSRSLCASGTTVYGVGRDVAELARTAELCRDCTGSFHHRLTDVRVADAVAELFSELPPIDVCFNNAGVAQFTPFMTMTAEELDAHYSVNVAGSMHVMREAAARMMMRKRGRIVVIASDAGYKGIPGLAAYVASKHAVVGLARTLGDEVGPAGVQVTIVYPGPVRTSILGPPGEGGVGMDPDELADTLVSMLLACGHSVRVTDVHLQPWSQP
jgi:NAD(P)-dependent dehydrogenase (short-subunit alcohol dehydrogenase family)